MRFADFLARCRAEWPSFPDSRALASALHPATRDLAGVLTHVEGMATENKLKLLSLAAASLDPDEVYVEVGSFRGATLIGAARNNRGVRIFACDNFSQFDGAAAVLRENLARHAPGSHVNFFDMEFRKFLLRAPWQPARIGAYFYDGRHFFADQYDALALAAPHFAHDALIIIDDSNKSAVRAANALFARKTRCLERVLDVITPSNKSPTWWNGVQVFRWRAADAAPASFGGADIALARFFFDTLYLGGRRTLRAIRKAPKRAMKRTIRRLRGEPRRRAAP
ncbi:MAG: class I SAM-dependent methyltransferase [Candidatus Binataceae bacterium]